MKTYPIALLLMITGFIYSCGTKPEHKSQLLQVTALVDVTDTRDVLPDAESLLSFYGFTKDKNAAAFFRLTTATDKLLNPVSEHHLISGDEMEKDNQFDDPDYREKQVLSFYSAVRHTVEAFNIKAKHDTVISHSECFRSIAGELARMKENKADKNLLAVYSDLGENSDLLNVYRKDAANYILKHTDSIVQKFEATGLLPQDLSGFTVLIIFQSKSREEDKMFDVMSRLYKKMLKAHGAKVTIRSNNPKNL